MPRKLKPYVPTDDDRKWVEEMVRIIRHGGRMNTRHAVYVIDQQKKVFVLETPSDPWETPLSALGHHRLEFVAALIGWTVTPKVDWDAIVLPGSDEDERPADGGVPDQRHP